MNEPYKILGMTDSPLLPTGYANQSRELFSRLSLLEDFECSFLGWSYKGQPMHVSHKSQVLSSDSNVRPKGTYKLLPQKNNPWGGPEQDPRVTPAIIDALNSEKPELLWTLCDSFMINYLATMDISPAKSLFYFPSDGWPLPIGTAPLFKKMNYLVGMSKFAQNQAIDEMGRTDCHYIPHGSDPNKFYPITDKEQLRWKWSERLQIDLRNKFIIGTVARNQGRKMTHELCKAFAEFAKDKNDVMLILHCDPFDPVSGGTFLLDLLHNRLKLAGKYCFTGTSWLKGFSDAEMNEVFNLFDLHALSTSGEGFGIPTIEAQACSVPSVITDFTNTRELVGENSERGIAVPTATTITGSYNVERGIIDTHKMAEAFELYYSDRATWKRAADKCRPFFLKSFDYDKVVFPAWKKYLLDVVFE